MSFPETGESTFPDSRKPVRMDTEDQSFGGKPSHNLGNNHGTHGNTHNATSTGNNVQTFTETMPLTGAPLVHHVHRDDEPLPGAKGGAQTHDYSPDNFDRTGGDFTTGSGQSQPFRSGEHTSTGNSARAYGGAITESSGDFRGPSMGSLDPQGKHTDLNSGVNATAPGTFDSQFDSQNTHGHGHGTGHHAHDSTAPGHVSQPVGDLKPHTGTHATAGHGRTDNYDTVTAPGKHDATHPDHHTGTANKPYDGAGNEPTNKASIGDKIIGKSEAIAGKITNKPALQEKGELRAAGLN